MSRRLRWASASGAAVAFFLTGLFPFFNADGFGHLAQGRQIAELGHVPKVDLFSFWKPTPQPWSNYEWAYDLGTWWLYDTLGASGLVVVKCLALAALGASLVLLATRLAPGRLGASPLTLAGLLLALPVARFRFTVRPQIVGLLFPALLLLGISALHSNERSRRGKGWVLAGLFLMHVVWVNAHGSHLLGAAITVIFFAFAWRTIAFRWMAGLVALQLLATGCTPFGYAIVGDALNHLLRPEFRTAVVEWAPWTPADPLRLLVAPAVSALLVLIALRPVARASRFGVAYAVLCVVLCAMAFRSTRFVAHQLVLTAPFIGAGLSSLPCVRELRRSLIPVVGIAGLVAGWWTAHLNPQFGFGFGEARRDYPWRSADVIETAVNEPRVLATIQDSWPMMFALPDARFLIDGRVPFYGPEFVGRITQSFADEAAFQGVLREFDVNVVAIDHTRADHVPATRALVANAQWKLVFVEDGHSLFVRNEATALPPLRIVGPGFREGRVLDPASSGEPLQAELARLAFEDPPGPLGNWLAGLVELRPLARDGALAGIRPAQTEAERSRAREAYTLLSRAADVYPGFTSIERLRALAALAACDIALAERALARATVTGETRETALAKLELDLRSDDPIQRRAATAHLEKLHSQPSTRNDPWVVALMEDPPPPCPPR